MSQNTNLRIKISQEKKGKYSPIPDLSFFINTIFTMLYTLLEVLFLAWTLALFLSWTARKLGNMVDPDALSTIIECAAVFNGTTIVSYILIGMLPLRIV